MSKDLIYFLSQRAKDGFISLQDVYDAIKISGLSFREIESLALENGFCPKRYEPNLGILTLQEQLRLHHSYVAIVGCGGLGGYVAELLARIGVGHLICIDHDNFSEQNLNRQCFCNINTLHKPKAFVLAEEIPKINPSTEVVPKVMPFCAENAGELLAGSHVVVDALDSLRTRADLASSCKKFKLPLVHGAVGGWYGQLGIQDAGFNNLEILFLSSAEKTSLHERVGTPSFTPALIASIQSAETIKIILKKDTVSFNKLFFIDLLKLYLDCGQIE